MQIRTVLAMAAAGAMAACLGACGDGREKLVGVEAAKGDTLIDYSAKIRDEVSISDDPALFQRFCLNLTGSQCAEDIGDKLKAYGFSNGKTGVDLGYAFALLAADERDKNPDGKSSDADYVEGAYKAVFGRAADPGGMETYTALIKDGTIESRKVMMQTLLQSPEFRSTK